MSNYRNRDKLILLKANKSRASVLIFEFKLFCQHIKMRHFFQILPAPTSKICKLDLKTSTASTVKKSINPRENKINPDISSKLSGHETRKERRGIFILNPR